MKRSVLFAASILGLGLSLSAPAFASTIVTENINGTAANGAKLTGTFTVDSSTGTVTSDNFTVAYNGNTYLFNTIHYQASAGGSYYFDSLDAANTDGILISFPQASLVGFTPEALCSTSNPCTGYMSNFNPGNVVGQGSPFTNLAPTPEPSSLALLGTGALGLAGALRRRFLRA